MELYNAYKGARVAVAPADCATLAALQAAVSKSESIGAADLLLLVAPAGTQLKSLPAAKVFAYDRRWGRERHSGRQHDGRQDGPAADSGAADSGAAARSEIVDEATALALANIRHNLSVAQRQVAKLRAAQAQLVDDVAACEHWRRYLDALRQIPALSADLPELLDVGVVETSHAELAIVWARIAAEMDALERRLRDLRAAATASAPTPSGSNATTEHATAERATAEHSALEVAQGKLVAALATAHRTQKSISTDLRRPLAAISDELRRAEELKAKVARVIDLPFLYGVLLIERARRQKWRIELAPVWERERARRAEWRKRYCTGTVGTLVDRLARIGQFVLSDEPGDPRDLNGSDGATAAAAASATAADVAADDDGEAAVLAYLQKLESLGLEDVCVDLRDELGAMKRQLARSVSLPAAASLAGSLVAGGAFSSHTFSPHAVSATPPPWPQPQPQPDVLNGATFSVPAYEARIRQLENMLMQSRLGSKTYELNIIRAETRAEARAEARAEIKAEQQQLRIAELEQQNAELAGRLQRYTTGLETVLNAIGLQTSRVDAETGAVGAYQINRVKGLSRNVAPPDAEDCEASRTADRSQASESAGRGAAAAARTGPASLRASNSSDATSKGSTHTVSIERVLEQTHVDNQVLFEAVTKRFGDVERLARKLQVENRRLRDRDTRMERDLRQRVALHSFRAEDLILFLPTRDSQRQPNPWAAFNAGAPHYFLHPKHTEQLQNREYLIARAASIERHVAADDDDIENIFQLPKGVEWFLITIHGEWGL